MSEPRHGRQGVTPSDDPVAVVPGSAPVPVRRGAGTIVLAILGFLVLSVLLVAVAGYLVRVLGPGTLAISLVLASIPLVIVLLGIRWIDRWEPEPRGALLFAFLWGAAASISIALVFSGITQYYEAAAGIPRSAGSEFFAAVFQAPVVEEFAKGLGILLVFWAMRRTFDGPVDGVVYGATIAIGFAFTENLQYFGLAIIEDRGFGSDIVQTFLLRAILSPFAHVMFTACTGLALGLAARRASGLGAVGYFIAGLIPAILLHAFWNSAGYWATDWFRYYFLVQVPLFALAIVGVARLRRHEQNLTRERLAEYAAVGWFTPTEVGLLSTAAGRRQAIAWASRFGLRPQYVRFVRTATRLAFTRQRVISGRGSIGAGLDESDLLAELSANRRALAALPSPA
ncbi:PrsW family intramembrane metalloprotease [Lacisediminihabitans profunda]|uniref:PrsW family intramembrane metalloprotease n=1 Tax=Lacisediminihabitans profunda TaxID=2594790 RepID=A0A5C8UV43_9MICO|nr:PrsW family intramembrane metalloprotease [Lacisediminihabitans profunda]TXN31469.1 PrsW family intramembrane metalloprotease [Lacisediminihabitans profunda]